MTTTRLMTFGHLEIAYDPEVLEPRTWTERQSAWAAELLESVPPGDVLELCAGVGHIGLLAVSRTSRHLVQVDVDERACELARRNAAGAAAADPAAGDGPGWSVEVRHGELEDVLRPGEEFTLVIADPPWVRSDDTTDHPDDPTSAIDGGGDGLELARSCLDVIGAHLASRGEAILQVGDRAQVEAIRTHVEAHPELGLRLVDHRVFDEGALVHLARLTVDAEG